MKKILVFLFAVWAFSPYLQTKEVLGRDEELRELREETQQLQSQFEQMKRSYDEKIRQLQAKIEEIEKERVIAPLPGIERPAIALPDISIVGDIVGTFSEDKGIADRNRIVARKVELALQGYLYPGIRADVFAALHRHGDEYKAELCEGYISFLETPVPGLSIRAGKQLLGFGKLNPRHAHHWDFVNRPAVLESYFGDHGASGQGVNFSYLLPLPFFTQWDVGAWHIDHHCPGHNHDHHHHILGLAEETYSTRLWSSFALSEDQELEIGLSGLKGYGSHYADHKDKVKIGGLDLTYRYMGPGPRRWLFQNEFLFLDREVPVGDLDRWGLYSFLNYRWDRLWCVGLRYDWMETPFPDKKEKSFISGILTHTLTCTTKLRLQYKYDLEDDNHTVFLQTTFGIGPHAHPLN